MRNLRKQSFGSQDAVSLYPILSLVLNIVIISWLSRDYYWSLYTLIQVHVGYQMTAVSDFFISRKLSSNSFLQSFIALWSWLWHSQRRSDLILIIKNDNLSRLDSSVEHSSILYYFCQFYGKFLSIFHFLLFFYWNLEILNRSKGKFELCFG